MKCLIPILKKKNSIEMYSLSTMSKCEIVKPPDYNTFKCKAMPNRLTSCLNKQLIIALQALAIISTCMNITIVIIIIMHACKEKLFR